MSIGTEYSCPIYFICSREALTIPTPPCHIAFPFLPGSVVRIQYYTDFLFVYCYECHFSEQKKINFPAAFALGVCPGCDVEHCKAWMSGEWNPYTLSPSQRKSRCKLFFWHLHFPSHFSCRLTCRQFYEEDTVRRAQFDVLSMHKNRSCSREKKKKRMPAVLWACNWTKHLCLKNAVGSDHMHKVPILLFKAENETITGSLPDDWNQSLTTIPDNQTGLDY